MTRILHLFILIFIIFIKSVYAKEKTDIYKKIDLFGEVLGK